MFHQQPWLRRGLLALAILCLQVFGTNLPGIVPFTIPSAIAATPVPTMPPGTKVILTEPSPDPIPYVASPGASISSSQENTNKWTITNYLNGILVPFFNSCSFFPWNAINSVSATSPISASVSACGAGGQTLTLSLGSIPTGLLPASLAYTNVNNNFPTQTIGGIAIGSLNSSTNGVTSDGAATPGTEWFVPSGSTNGFQWGTYNGTTFTQVAQVDASGNATFQGSITASGSIIQFLSSANMLFGTAAGSLQVGTPGSGTTVAGIGCSLFGVASKSTAWRLCMDTSGNVGATNFFSSSQRSHKQAIVPLFKVMPDPLSILIHTDWAQFRYLPAYGDPSQVKVGFIADDTPAVLSGPHHDHMDAEALGTVDAQAILQLKGRVDGLEALIRHLCVQQKKDPVCGSFLNH